MKRRLNRTISEEEDFEAAKMSKNGGALGFDDFQAERIKFIPPILRMKINDFLKKSFDGSEDVEYGHEVLVRLQKTGKTKAMRKTSTEFFATKTQKKNVVNQTKT